MFTPEMFRLDGRVALVTGASSGLGADAARAYAAFGADLALLDVQDEKLAAVAEEVREKTGRKVAAIHCDVTSEEEIQKAVAEVMAAFGKIDILLNNAGTVAGGSVEQIPHEAWDRVVAVNLTGPYLVSKYVLPHMKEAGYGKVVNMASVSAVCAEIRPSRARHEYNATKAGLVGLTKGMAATYMAHGITVNAIGPSLFNTGMTENSLMASRRYLDDYNNHTPAHRPAKDGELNGTLIYLSSEASSYVTGQFILVDGGLTISG